MVIWYVLKNLIIFKIIFIDLNPIQHIIKKINIDNFLNILFLLYPIHFNKRSGLWPVYVRGGWMMKDEII